MIFWLIIGFCLSIGAAYCFIIHYPIYPTEQKIKVDLYKDFEHQEEIVKLINEKVIYYSQNEN